MLVTTARDNVFRRAPFPRDIQEVSIATLGEGSEERRLRKSVRITKQFARALGRTRTVLVGVGEVGLETAVDLARDVALEAIDVLPGRR